MVNIAFPYNEDNASSMEMALLVLKSMAEKGNKYIQACHALLTKIRANIKATASANSAIEPVIRREIGDMHGVRLQGLAPPTQSQHANEPLNGSLSDSTTVVSGGAADGAAEGQTPDFALDGDPTLWAEVLESIGIDMDRQWVETTLLADDGTG